MLTRLITLCVLLLALCSGAAVSAPSVTTSTINYEPYAKTVRVSGRLVNKSEQKLSFKIQGVVAEILVDEGQEVKAGQLLAQLDKAEITAQVKQAQSVYDNSSKNLRRFERLYQDKVITQEQLQSAQTKREVARSDLQIALFNQKHAEIRATNDGRILKRLIEKQELVSPNRAAFVISNDGRGWILRTEISDKDIVHLQQNDLATIELDAYPHQQLTGLVSEIAAAADTRSGLFELEVRLDPTPLRIYSGFVAKASIQTSHNQSVAFIPLESIVAARGQEAEVYVLTPEKTAQKRAVTLAFIEGGQAAVATGLEDGDTLISEGAAYLRPGLEVNVVQP